MSTLCHCESTPTYVQDTRRLSVQPAALVAQPHPLTPPLSLAQVRTGNATLLPEVLARLSTKCAGKGITVVPAFSSLSHAHRFTVPYPRLARSPARIAACDVQSGHRANFSLYVMQLVWCRCWCALLLVTLL